MKTLLLVAGLLLGLVSRAQAQVFSCPSGFIHLTSAGACGVSYIGEGGAAFAIVGTANGSSPAISGTAVNLMPGSTTHAALSLNYQTQVNEQAFTSTFTFVPNGWNIVFMVQNSNNNPSFNTNNFSAGAGCEADFFQGFSQAAPPNNLFVLELDQASNQTDPGSFVYSTAQIYQAGYSPCNPDLGGTNFTYVSTPKISTSPVPLNSPSSTVNTTTGDTYSATVSYDGTNFTLNLYDVTASGSCPGASCFSNTWSTMPAAQGGGSINIPSKVGANTAWVGLGAGTNAAVTGSLLINTWAYTVNTAAGTSAGSKSYGGGGMW